MRRARALRKRYGRAGYRIGSRGLEKPGSIKLTPGHVYSMGASSSPQAIRVLSVTSDRIQYQPETKFGDTSPRVIQRWIGEDLIAQGERTFRQRYGVSTQRWYTMTEAERGALFKREGRY